MALCIYRSWYIYEMSFMVIFIEMTSGTIQRVHIVKLKIKFVKSFYEIGILSQMFT